MTPDSSLYNPDPQYLRDLLDRAGLSQRKAAEIIGVGERTFRNYLDGRKESQAPYTVQFALEALANRKP